MQGQNQPPHLGLENGGLSGWIGWGGCGVGWGGYCCGAVCMPLLGLPPRPRNTDCALNSHGFTALCAHLPAVPRLKHRLSMKLAMLILHRRLLIPWCTKLSMSACRRVNGCSMSKHDQMTQLASDARISAAFCPRAPTWTTCREHLPGHSARTGRLWMTCLHRFRSSNQGSTVAEARGKQQFQNMLPRFGLP